MDTTSYVLVGVHDPRRTLTAKDADQRVKVLGPFGTPDDAREAANLTGMAGDAVLWVVRPLM